MKVVLVLLGTCIALALARPENPEPIAIVSQESNQEPDGSYQYSYETADGTKVQQTGTLRKATSPEESDVIVSSGVVSYTAPDGTVINLKYVSDENGFAPEGDHLPTPPPTPDAIAKAIEYLKSLPPPKE